MLLLVLVLLKGHAVFKNRKETSIFLSEGGRVDNFIWIFFEPLLTLLDAMSSVSMIPWVVLPQVELIKDWLKMSS